MESFTDALKQGNLEKIRAFPKSDLHNHFILGGSRQYLHKMTGIKIEPVKTPILSMDEMHAWNRENLGKRFETSEMRKLLIQAETVEKIRERLTEVFVLTGGYLQVPKKKELPSAENLRGTYEEMYSNWKNKMTEAAGGDDVYSSFMNLLSLQWMFYEIAEYIAVDDFEIMDKFNPKNLEENVDVFDQALNKYLAEYEKVGIRPKHFESMTEFIESYNKEISEEI